MDCESSGKNSQVKINTCERGETERDAEEIQSFHEANMGPRRLNVTQRRIRAFRGSARVTRAGERVLAIANFLKALAALEELTFKRSWFGRDAETNMTEACATQSHLPPMPPASPIAAMLDIRLIREKPDF